MALFRVHVKTGPAYKKSEDAYHKFCKNFTADERYGFIKGINKDVQTYIAPPGMKNSLSILRGMATAPGAVLYGVVITKEEGPQELQRRSTPAAEGTNGSAPPPPPPASSSSGRPVLSATKKPLAGASPKPFLRKGSRVEPTALNRMKKEAQMAGSPNSNKREGLSPLHQHQHQHPEHAAAAVVKAKMNRSSPVADVPIEVLAPKQKKPSHQDASVRKEAPVFDPNDMSDAWEKNRLSALRELEEFEMIEQQVEAAA